MSQHRFLYRKKKKPVLDQKRHTTRVPSMLRCREWHSDADQPRRRAMVHELTKLLTNSHPKNDVAWHAQVAVLVRRLECALYVAAASAAEYADLATLDERVGKVDYAAAAATLPLQRECLLPEEQPVGECPEERCALMMQALDVMKRSERDAAAVRDACDTLHSAIKNKATQHQFHRMSGMSRVMRCLSMHAGDAGVASSACNVVGVAVYRHAPNQAEASMGVITAVMRLHRHNVDVANSSMAALLDLTTDACDVASRDRMVSTGVPEAVLQFMRSFPNLAELHAEGCELLARAIHPGARRPPAFAAAAVRAARAVLESVPAATADGLTIATELVSLLAAAPAVQTNARPILVACAAAARANPTVDILHHNVYCVACNMVNAGGRPVADIVAGIGLLAAAGRRAATCPAAVETCLCVMEFGAGVPEACACGLPELLREADPSAALVVADIMVTYETIAERAAAELLAAEMAAKVAAVAKPRRKPRALPRKAVHGVTPTMDMCMPVCTPMCTPAAAPAAVTTPPPTPPRRGRTLSDAAIARRTAAKYARFARQLKYDEGECYCWRLECESCTILSNMATYARRMCIDLEL